MSVETRHKLICDGCGAETVTRAQGLRPPGWHGSSRYRNSTFGEDYCATCSEERAREALPEGVELPEIGQDIYIRSAYYIDHGEDDFDGGLCKINRIEYNPGCPNLVNRIMVGIV